MKKNVIAGHMNPPKRGFGAFFKKISIIPFLLCVVLAVILWLVTVNLAETSSDAQETAETSVAATEAFVHAI